jgi:hypothetical protein
MRKAGLRFVVGSWKIMEMWRPRSASISASEADRISRPSNRIDPPR